MKEKKKKLYRFLESDNSVGVEFTDDIINIYFPLGYDISSLTDDISEKKAILDLLRTISLCKNNNTYEEFNFNDGEENNIPINSYLWVINDYLKNGLYNVIDKKYLMSQKGKINWKKTFKTKPLFDNNDIVYLNTITEYKTKYDNIITEIHAVCINTSIDKMGWIFGSISKVENYKQSYSNQVYLEILNNELLKSFNDRKKTLLKHLINIIKEKSDNDKSDTINNLLVNNYHYAWEKMLDYVFGNVKLLDKKQYFPEIIWQLHSGKNPKPLMRPDTIISKNNNQTIFILDAKYYKYGVIENGSLPGVESIDKQITYGQYNSLNFNTNDVYNAFILPFNMNANLFKSDVPIKTVGTVKSVGRSLTGNPYENIVVILMDTKYLIDLYFKRKSKDTNYLLSSIINEFNN